MKKRIFALLAIMITNALLTTQSAGADLVFQCMLGVPTYKRAPVKSETNSLPITINANHAKGSYPDNAVFTGNVDINQGNSRLQADKVLLHQVEVPGQEVPVRTVDALGNVHYDNNQIILIGPKAWSNLNTKDTNVWKGNYQMVGHQGHGTADLIKQRGENRYTILNNGTFTSCLPDSNIWSIVGSEVIQDRQEQVAGIWNARFKIGQIPIFYSPYLRLPIGDKRRSGFLNPNAKYNSTNGIEFHSPYYWNIAPNFDATITPHYMDKRDNIIWENEFLYLIKEGSGLFEFNYLPSDKIYEKEHPNDDNSRRWMFYWRHLGTLNREWQLNVDYTKVSDANYFNDFSSKYGSSTDGYATQKFSLGYFIDNFDASISSKHFQVFDRENSNSYAAEPQLDVTYYCNELGSFNAHIYGQAVKFKSTNNNLPKATRLHLEPVVALPLSNSWSSLNTEVKLIATHYQQKNLDEYRTYAQNKYNKDQGNNSYARNLNAANSLKYSVNRLLPQLKIDEKMVFERDINWLQGYTQILEPRVQYLHVPYKDQSDIGVYDSTLLQSDYSGLFRDTTYSGLDRIASANQVTSGLTTRIYDDHAVERFMVSLGRIYYFTESRNGDDNLNLDNRDKRGPLVWATDTIWRMTDRFGLRGSIQYDTRLNNVAAASGTVEYRHDQDRLVQLNYRYASPEYIQATLPYIASEQYNQGISQASMTVSWPIVNRWSVLGAYYFDTNTRKSVDQMLGVQYSSCCYAIRVNYERKLNGWNANSNESKYDNTFGFNIELRGLNSNYGLSTSTQQMLRSNILPYQSSI